MKGNCQWGLGMRRSLPHPRWPITHAAGRRKAARDPNDEPDTLDARWGASQFAVCPHARLPSRRLVYPPRPAPLLESDRPGAQTSHLAPEIQRVGMPIFAHCKPFERQFPKPHTHTAGDPLSHTLAICSLALKLGCEWILVVHQHEGRGGGAVMQREHSGRQRRYMVSLRDMGRGRGGLSSLSFEWPVTSRKRDC